MQDHFQSLISNFSVKELHNHFQEIKISEILFSKIQNEMKSTKFSETVELVFIANLFARN